MYCLRFFPPLILRLVTLRLGSMHTPNRTQFMIVCGCLPIKGDNSAPAGCRVALQLLFAGYRERQLRMLGFCGILSPDEIDIGTDVRCRSRENAVSLHDADGKQTANLR